VIDTVILTLLNRYPDPQYGGHWEASLDKLTVIDSLLAHGCHVTVLHDCLDGPAPDGVHLVEVAPDYDVPNAYWARWHLISEYLIDAFFIDRVWCVDGGDVRLLRDPWSWMRKGILYLGTEPTCGIHARSLDFWWLSHLHPSAREFVERNRGRPLVNPGITGGDRVTVCEFAHDVFELYDTRDLTDVSGACMVAYSDKWKGRWVTGDRVHTDYWSYTDNGYASWQHK
jgi:hypothetical protein